MEASPQQPNFVEVCSVEDIWEGEMQCFWVRDASILLLKLDGRLRAYQGRCPHQGFALVDGDLGKDRFLLRGEIDFHMPLA